MDICIRGINSNVVKALETSAKKHDLSREEYLRQCLERIAYDDRALGSKYEQQLQKLFQCLEGQQKQLSLLIVGMEQVEESCCRLEDGLLEKESWSEESEGAIVGVGKRHLKASGCRMRTCLSFRTFRRNMGCRIFPKRSVT